jgi:eukaryotic-like serine/threonine-protein kinase
LGRSLLEIKDADGATAAFQKALALNPSGAAAKDLARALAPQGRLEEARVAWGRVLEQDPPDHKSWYGYAPLCLFLGDKQAYQAARRGLLARFGETSNDWILAERVSLACLLGPGSADELRRSVNLAEGAIRAGAHEPNNPYLLFLNGLMEYRLERYGTAIPLLNSSAAQLPNRAGPRLVLAMAEHRSGAEREARESLALAVSDYNWRASHADHTTAWGSHALRREATELIVPAAASLLRGESAAIDNYDRMAVFSLCEFEGHNLRGSRLAADAFAADGEMADHSTRSCLTRAALESDIGNRSEVLDSDLRYRAACCASLSAEGRDRDSAALAPAERAQWRMRAIDWLKADLVVLSDVVENGHIVDADLVKQKLILWREDPAFEGIRDSHRLQYLSADERKACIKLWDEVQAILARCGDAE